MANKPDAAEVFFLIGTVLGVVSTILYYRANSVAGALLAFTVAVLAFGFWLA